MKYSVRISNQFKKQYKLCIKRGLDVELLNKAMCHISPDWLLVWEQNDTELTLLFLETGTHSDLFN